ncbi:MAG: hypothetical protein IT290_08750 [Deltaproteobacteria bacterium]|nr:hypothetical protein [Deltaproteobacteria bacterium]
MAEELARQVSGLEPDRMVDFVNGLNEEALRRLVRIGKRRIADGHREREAATSTNRDDSALNRVPGTRQCDLHGV